MKHIRLINDDQETLEVMVTALQSYGYEVDTQHSDADVRGLLERACPDLVIIDYSEDEVQGEKAYRSLISHEISRNVPVIVMSDNIAVILSLDYERDDVFIMKPFDLNFLLQQISCCIASSECSPDYNF
jgi:DNA-binding response OmpR family regulator